MDKYEIVNSTQLNAALTEIADALRAKLGGSAQYAFPADYISAIAKLFYDANPNTVNDINVNNRGEIVVNAGVFESNTTKAIPGNYVNVSDITITSAPAGIAENLAEGKTITIPAGYYPNAIQITAPTTA